MQKTVYLLTHTCNTRGFASRQVHRAVELGNDSPFDVSRFFPCYCRAAADASAPLGKRSAAYLQAKGNCKCDGVDVDAIRTQVLKAYVQSLANLNDEQRQTLHFVLLGDSEGKALLLSGCMQRQLCCLVHVFMHFSSKEHCLRLRLFLSNV
jgi:hypothetical protein